MLLKSLQQYLQGLWRSRSSAVLALILVLPAAPALGQNWDVQENTDPLIEINKVVFQLNDYFDALLLRPMAVGYSNYTPQPLRTGVSNFFSNMRDLNAFANNLLQGKVTDAMSDCGRFLINSTVGIGGLVDVAGELGLEKHEEDFGQTLAVWGVGPGPYVVLPVFGPSSLRDSASLVLDWLMNPLYYIEHDATRVSTFSMERLDWRLGLLPADALITGDRYLFLREAYFQNRDFAINDGALENPFGDL